MLTSVAVDKCLGRECLLWAYQSIVKKPDIGSPPKASISSLVGIDPLSAFLLVRRENLFDHCDGSHKGWISRRLVDKVVNDSYGRRKDPAMATEE